MDWAFKIAGFIFGPIFGFIGGLVKKIPIWAWAILGLTLLIWGGWMAYKYNYDTTIANYEKRITESQKAEAEAKKLRATAEQNATALKAERDRERESAETARLERDALNSADAALQNQLRSARAKLAANAAQERADLGDPEKFSERLSAINDRVGCLVDASNNNTAGDCGQ